MRKNNTLRAAGILLALVMITTSFVGGTFAKYLSVTNDTDNARIANWGFEAYNANFDLFADEYVNASNEVIVKSENGDNVYAPGTGKETEITFRYSEENLPEGITAPEVAYKLSFDIEFLGSLAGGDLYDHLVYTLTFNGSKKSYATEAEFVTALATLVGVAEDEVELGSKKIETNYGIGTAKTASVSKNYAPGELPEFMKNGGKLIVGWEWAFEQTDHDCTDHSKDGCDHADTDMGNYMAWFGPDEADQIILNLHMVAEQIQSIND